MISPVRLVSMLMLQKRFGASIAHYFKTLTITSDNCKLTIGLAIATTIVGVHAEYEKAKSEK